MGDFNEGLYVILICDILFDMLSLINAILCILSEYCGFTTKQDDKYLGDGGASSCIHYKDVDYNTLRTSI